MRSLAILKVCPEPKPCKRMQALANPSCKPHQAPASVSSTKIERGRKRTEASDGVPQAGLRRLGFPASASVKWQEPVAEEAFAKEAAEKAEEHRVAAARAEAAQKAEEERLAQAAAAKAAAEKEEEARLAAAKAAAAQKEEDRPARYPTD